MAMRRSELRPSVPAARSKGQVRAGLRYVASVPELGIPLVMMAIIGTLAFNFQVVLPLFVTRDLGGAAGTFTLLYSVLSAGSFVGALATARRSRVTLRMVVAGAAAFGVAMVVLAAAPGLPAAFAVAAVVGASSIAFMTSSTALVQTEAGPDMRGRVLALQSMVFLGSTPIGGPVLGAVCEVLGARAGLLVGGIGALTAAAFGAWAIRRTAGRTPAALDRPPLAAG